MALVKRKSVDIQVFLVRLRNKTSNEVQENLTKILTFL